MIFVDTSFWIALAYGRDVRHADAVTLIARSRGVQLVTTNHVRGETWTFLRRRTGHREAVAFLDRLERTPRLDVRRVDREVEAEAWAFLRRRDDRSYSFVDAVSFMLMRRLGVLDALTFDGDFAAAGFRELRA